MHYGDVDLGLASLWTDRRDNFFVMDFPAVRLNAHALNVIFSRRRCLCLHFDDVIPDLLKAVVAGLSSPTETLFNMHDGRYIHRSRHFY